MQKCYFSLLIFAIMSAACESDLEFIDSNNASYDPVKVICISPSYESTDEATRGTPITSINQMTDMGVYCSYTGTTDWNGATSTLGKMFNTNLTRNASNGVWAYSGAPVYWASATNNDRYTFFAYAPQAAAGNGLVIEGSGITTGIPYLTYTASASVSSQPDLMFAVPRYNSRPISYPVSLDMRHALTCVGFQVQGNGERIKSITISGVASKGRAMIDGSNIVWDITNQPTSPIDYSAILNYDPGQIYVTAPTAMSTNLIAGNGYLMMVPQTLGANAKLTITMANNSKREITLNSQQWTVGKKITYNIMITPEAILVISPAPYYVSSMGQIGFSVPMQLTCTPANARWTLSSENSWLRLTPNIDGSNASSTISGQGATTIYVVVDAHTATNAERTCKLYAYSDPTKVISTITQLKHVIIPNTNYGGTRFANISTYVGAFWRNNDIGERIIRIPVGATAGNLGNWAAYIVWKDANWKEDDIRFSTAASGDGSISYTQDIVPRDANLYPVPDRQPLVTGSVAANGIIYFRMGINTAYTPTAAAPARYAVVALTYNNRGTTYLMFLRQGEGEDYVMRKTDAISGDYTSATRPYSRKFMAYNITQPGFRSWTPTNIITTHPVVNFRQGALTDFPSQSGALFQWASPDQTRRAYHPTTPTTTLNTWSIQTPLAFWKSGVPGSQLADIHELCPSGYKRFNNGDENIVPLVPFVNSELYQSLYLIASNDNNYIPTNATDGYYADGFFDRRYIKSSPTNEAASTVSYIFGANDNRNSLVAYKGTVVYNPYSGASLFLPSSGARLSTGALIYNGYLGFYFTATNSTADFSRVTAIVTGASIGINVSRTIARAAAINLRCVKTEP